MRGPSCEACKEFYSKKNRKQPVCGSAKCGKGKVKPLLEENEDAIFVFGHVRNQAIFGGIDAIPIDVKFESVKFIMDLYEIENQRECYEKVLKAWHHVAAIDRLKRSSKP